MSDSFYAATTAAGPAWARGCRASRARNLLMGVAGIVLGKGTDVEKVGADIGKREDGGRSNARGCCWSASVGSEKPFRCAFCTPCAAQMLGLVAHSRSTRDAPARRAAHAWGISVSPAMPPL